MIAILYLIPFGIMSLGFAILFRELFGTSFDFSFGMWLFLTCLLTGIRAIRIKYEELKGNQEN